MISIIRLYQKNQRAILYFLIVLFCIIFYFNVLKPQKKYYDAHHVNIQGIYLLNPLVIPKFTLTDNHNHRFSNENLQGQWTLLFFGFTHCATVCPITMSAINQMYQQLILSKSNVPLPQVVFMSVDPDSDTIKIINDYVTSFNPHFIGVKTTAENTTTIENQFHIVSIKTKTTIKNVDYPVISHSAEILLINPEGKIQAYFAYPHTAKQLIKDYSAILGMRIKIPKGEKP
ncbi:MAG: SCO family protein [Gammaproteobacteria bacterium]|nr:SCO family protein [Gammaproteobacteria bacterium]